MRQEIEIYLHGPGTTDEKLIRTFDDAIVRDVIEAAKQVGFANGSNVFVIIEDDEEPLHEDACLRDIGVKHKHHLHCHTCHKVDVIIHFNGSKRERKFAPSRKVKGILKWALSEFGLTGIDAENKELRLGGANGTILQGQQHIGSFVGPSHCHLELYLTGIVEVQG